MGASDLVVLRIWLPQLAPAALVSLQVLRHGVGTHGWGAGIAGHGSINQSRGGLAGWLEAPGHIQGLHLVMQLLNAVNHSLTKLTTKSLVVWAG